MTSAAEQPPNTDITQAETRQFILVVAVVALTTYISGIVLYARNKSPGERIVGNVMLILCILAVLGGWGVFNAYRHKRKNSK